MRSFTASSPGRLGKPGLILIWRDDDEGSFLQPGAEVGGLTGTQFSQEFLLGLIHDHGARHSLAVVLVAQLMGKLQVGVAQRIRRQLLRGLVGDDKPFSVGAHL